MSQNDSLIFSIVTPTLRWCSYCSW